MFILLVRKKLLLDRSCPDTLDQMTNFVPVEISLKKGLSNVKEKDISLD
jgi:hypothetical protein